MNQQFQSQQEPIHLSVQTLGLSPLTPQKAPLQGAQELPGRLEDLLSTLQQESADRKKKRRQMLMYASLCGAGVVSMIFIAVTTKKLSVSIMHGIFSIINFIQAARAVSQKHKDATRQIALFDDLRAVGPLAEALEFPDPDMRQIATNALIRLLKRLQATDASLLNVDQRACLYRALNEKNTELTQAILKALEQVGDSKALPFVERLAAGEGRAGEESRVREAAQACLPSLRQRAEQERSSHELLRAADGNVTAPAQLLRPASGTTAPEAHHLLRASATNEKTG